MVHYDKISIQSFMNIPEPSTMVAIATAQTSTTTAKAVMITVT